MSSSNRKGNPPPVRVGELKRVPVDNLGHAGEGVGRVGRFTVFVDGAIPGDLVLAKIVEVKKRFARAEVQEILTPSSERVEPSCPHYELCGGCQLQHMNYPAQLKWKRQRVVDALIRIGGLPDVSVSPTIGMEKPLYYRNKAQYPVGMENGTVVMGFFQRGTHRIVDLKDCQIESKINSRVLTAARRLIQQLAISVYDEVQGTGHIRHVVARTSRMDGSVMVIIVTNGEEVLRFQELVQALVEEVPQIVSVAQNINTEKTNRIMGPRTKIIWGDEGIIDQLGDLRFFISPRSFFQVNPVQTEVLYSKALEFAGLTGAESVFDLYCGIGSISLFLARQAKRVVGIDEVPEAIADARKNANLNGIENAYFYAGKVERKLPELVSNGIPADVVVLDPPRAGCQESVLETLLELSPRRIVYVSCNPSTLARDLARLVEGGKYEVIEVQPVDMFPHTSHVESVVRIKRR